LGHQRSLFESCPSLKKEGYYEGSITFMALPKRWRKVTDSGWTLARARARVTALFTAYCPIVVRMIVWTVAVSSWDAAIHYRKGTGTETTHGGVGTQGMTRSTRWAAVWAMRRPAHDGHNPRRLQLKASSTSCVQVSQPSRSKPWARVPHCK
jgi:hypothetical protein